MRVRSSGKSDGVIRRFSLRHFTSPKDGPCFFDGTIDGEGALPGRRRAPDGGPLPPQCGRPIDPAPRVGDLNWRSLNSHVGRFAVAEADHAQARSADT